MSRPEGVSPATFLRPAARAMLWRWREVAAGLALSGVGLWGVVGGIGITRWVGAALALAGVALIWAALQRLRFARGGGGIGVVQIDERRVSYFGPLTGGLIDLDDLASLSLDGTARPAHWRLVARDRTELAIPVDAEGADALFDAFAALPGLVPSPLIAALNAPEKGLTRLWSRAAPHVVRLRPPG